jgi:hypothetical protein
MTKLHIDVELLFQLDWTKAVYQVELLSQVMAGTRYRYQDGVQKWAHTCTYQPSPCLLTSLEFNLIV